ncbi:hypothetical protein BC835DRAFT_1423503 [Cytidiella melzeri]|nr:hypothetical protein BC835DRAFT_1423503 [Cytidiella melzeri]
MDDEDFHYVAAPKLQDLPPPPSPTSQPALTLDGQFDDHLNLVERLSPTETTSDTPSDYIPGLLTLGSTYNVLNGKYADSRSCLQHVIEWNLSSNRVQAFGGKSYTVPTIANYNTNTTSEYRSSYGKTASDYTKSLSLKAGFDASFPGFSASASADYGDSQRDNLSHAFTRITYNVTHYSLSLPPVRRIRHLLKPWFIEDIVDMDPMEFFKEYGTHFLCSLTVGGRALFLYSTDTRKYSSTVSIEAAAKISASYSVASGGVEMSASHKQAMESFNESSQCSVITKGGDPRYGNEEFLKNVGEWAASIVDYPEFVEFGSLPCFQGIWELAPTRERRQELQEAFPVYVKLYSRDLQLPGPYVEARLSRAFDEEKNAWFGHGDPKQYLAVKFLSNRTDAWYFVTPGVDTRESVLVKELVPGALAPVKWVVVFDGTYRSRSTRFWTAVPPTSDYVALGCVGMTGWDLPDQPPESLAGRFRAVHKRALSEAHSQDGVDHVWRGEKNHLLYSVDYRYLYADTDVPPKKDCFVLDEKMTVKEGWVGW